jgi:hypothetical protein
MGKIDDSGKQVRFQSTSRKASVLGAVLIFITVLLIIGNAGYFVVRKNQAAVLQRKLDGLTKQLDTASAKFEIGYSSIEVSLYNKMRFSNEGKKSDLLSYPVVQNSIDTLIQSGQIISEGVYKESRDYWLKDFPALHKQKKVGLRETEIVCLIVQQVGKGTATNVSLALNYVEIKEPVSMYDPTDIGTPDHSGSWEQVPHSTKTEKLNLKQMKTGDSWLIPMYINHVYDRTDHVNSDPNVWSLTAGPLYIPLTLTYIPKNKRAKSIALQEVLSRPVVLSQ